MSLIDTHVHLNFSQFHSDLETVIERCWDNGLEAMINIGTDLTTSQESINLATRFTNIYAAVGLHPHEADDWENQIDGLKQLARQSKVVAIGEIGLDYFRNLASHEHQVAAFKAQLDLAIQIGKPVVLHCRDAYTEVMTILEEDYLPKIGTRLPGVVHCFNAGPAYAQRFLKMGFYLGINNLVAYPSSTSLQEALKIIPLDRIVLETDCPYLPPYHLKNQRCEPIYVQEVVKKIAEIKEVSLEKVETITTMNARNIFNLNA